MYKIYTDQESCIGRTIGFLRAELVLLLDQMFGRPAFMGNISAETFAVFHVDSSIPFVDALSIVDAQ